MADRPVRPSRHTPAARAWPSRNSPNRPALPDGQCRTRPSSGRNRIPIAGASCRTRPSHRSIFPAPGPSTERACSDDNGRQSPPNRSISAARRCLPRTHCPGRNRSRRTPDRRSGSLTFPETDNAKTRDRRSGAYRYKSFTDPLRNRTPTITTAVGNAANLPDRRRSLRAGRVQSQPSR